MIERIDRLRRWKLIVDSAEGRADPRAVRDCTGPNASRSSSRVETSKYRFPSETYPTLNKDMIVVYQKRPRLVRHWFYAGR